MLFDNLTADHLAWIFLTLMGFAALVYAVLDGYDLGVGIILPTSSSIQLPAVLEEQRNQMIASIGPFWDANETWLVLAIGILLIAFPGAYSLVLRELYIPTVLLLIGLALRGVSFDFRAKAVSQHREIWDYCFKIGSALAALTQGYMLGRYVLGFEHSTAAYFFALLSSLCVTAAYAYIGGTWLVMKTKGDLQRKAAYWARRAGWLAALGILAISIANPLISEDIAARWFTFPAVILLIPIPLVCGGLIFAIDQYLKHVPHTQDFACSFPFIGVTGIFLLTFFGLAYSYFPYVIPHQMLATDAASAAESLRFVLYGTALVLPVIVLYTIFSYRVFWGKTTELKYY